ncbi:hypothetical protein [Amycolatopsis palatopharyngis]|uniref:hypothetical protein n=1 Tax=Amycolatopsis palatopharyngis TaxID=187982 RepID=UPI000E27AF45|nr:hypothetical protein [Amycolatopsis palatopharyngis]
MSQPQFVLTRVTENRAWVCTSLPLASATDRVNVEYPSRPRWRLASPPATWGKGADRGRCDRSPKTHRHYVFTT